MIEVTQKDLKGRIQSRATYTEREFGYAYCYQSHTILADFGTEHEMIGSHEESIGNGVYRRVADFNLVAYNERGKVLDPTHLIGIIRKYYTVYHWYWRTPGTKSQKRRVRGSSMRKIHTTPERRASFACMDQEEYAPKVRGRRNAHSLPESWDDYWRFNEKNWKKFRKHQWKSKS